MRQTCSICAGLGWTAPAPEDGADEQPEGLALCGEFLEAWGLVERYGPSEALGLFADRGGQGWDAVFVEALGVFNGELDRLEQESMVERADEERQRRPRK